MNIYLEKVTIENKEILFRLLQYSLFEESLNDGNEMNDNALFDYIYFDKYFIEKEREAYFIKDQEQNTLLIKSLIKK